MGTWNYRVVRYRDNSGYGLHEVFYDNDGLPWSMTKRAVSFVVGPEEGAEGIIDSLLTARVDAKRRPILDQPRKWPGKNPGADFKLKNTG